MVWLILPALLLLLILVVLVRTLSFVPKKEEETAMPLPESFDREAPVAALQELVRCYLA